MHYRCANPAPRCVLNPRRRGASTRQRHSRPPWDPTEKPAGRSLKCQKPRDRLGDWMVEMGPDLGIARKGNEIHFSLPERKQLEEV